LARVDRFGDNGAGTPFCVPRDGGDAVLAWNPIDAQAHALADTIARFWSGWTSGLITT
jgi:hypothetical protein